MLDKINWQKCAQVAIGVLGILFIITATTFSIEAKRVVLVDAFFWGALFLFGGIYLVLAGRGDSIRHLRARSGLCTFCGYDLRATKDRCPECGKTV